MSTGVRHLISSAHGVSSESDKKEKPVKALVPSTKTKSHRTDSNYESVLSLLKMVAASNIETYVNALSGFHTRHTKSKFINDVAVWLKDLLRSFDYTDVYFDEFSKDGYELKNVICNKRGIDNRIILIGAHFDSIMEDTNKSDERAPGADDNASGVSVVLEVARIISRVKSEYSIQFIFFSGEEQGQWGSENYAQHAHTNNVNLHRMINLDMVGRPHFDNQIIIERDLGNKVSFNDRDSQGFAEILEQSALDYTDLKVMLGPIYDSDYMPFEARGYVVVGIYDGGQIFPTYHSRNDLPSHLNMDYLVSVTKMILATIFDERVLSSKVDNDGSSL